ncbi:MAG TPA: hypothetical protein VD967_00655, partial [Candidatus Paceibacterota bacterium]|nr:hypothetical protein [Candidatus Paceibacterota bacterium]
PSKKTKVPLSAMRELYSQKSKNPTRSQKLPEEVLRALHIPFFQWGDSSDAVSESLPPEWRNCLSREYNLLAGDAAILLRWHDQLCVIIDVTDYDQDKGEIGILILVPAECIDLAK